MAQEMASEHNVNPEACAVANLQMASRTLLRLRLRMLLENCTTCAKHPNGQPATGTLTGGMRLNLGRWLASERFVMFTPGRSPLYTQIISACAVSGFTPNVVQDAAHIVTVLGLVRADLGVALVPKSVQALQPTGVDLRPLRGVAVRAETAIAWRRDGLSPVGEAFLSAARAVAR